MALQYIGARYVPRFTGPYVNTQAYEALDVADNGLGTSYIAKIPVPAGTPLTNTTYWAIYGATSGAIVNLQSQIDVLNNKVEPLEKNAESYAPIVSGRITYTGNSHETIVNYSVIDKEYKPRLVMAGNAIKDSNGWIKDDGGKISAREKATVAINANGLFSSESSCGTVIVDGEVEYTCDIDSAEWSGHDLHNLYMKEDGSLHAIDAFASVSTMLDESPVWSFCGDNMIYYDGVVHHTITENTVSPHSVIAQDYLGNYLVMTTGGRRVDDYGMNYDDVIDCIKNVLGFNAKMIYLADGGGSSTIINHQMRLNRLIEKEPRNICTMLVFCEPDVTSYSDFESGYSQYLDDIENKKTKSDISFNGNVAVEILGNGATTFRQSFYKGVQDASIDSWSYTEMMRLAFNEVSHVITLLGRDHNDNMYTRLELDMPNNSAKLLGREVLRGSAINSASAQITLGSNGVFDASDIIGNTLPLDTIILSAYTEENSLVVLPFNYNNKWLFAVKNISDMSSAGAATVTAHIAYITSPILFPVS